MMISEIIGIMQNFHSKVTVNNYFIHKIFYYNEQKIKGNVYVLHNEK